MLPEGRLEISPNFFKISPKFSQQQKTAIKDILTTYKSYFLSYRLMLDMKTFFLNTIIFLEKNLLWANFFCSVHWKSKKLLNLKFPHFFPILGISQKGKKFPRSYPEFPQNWEISPNLVTLNWQVEKNFNGIMRNTVIPRSTYWHFFGFVIL